jgi:hypothetical protein
VSGAEDGRGFAERLEWLLASVPQVAGTQTRFSIEDLVSALSHAVPGPNQSGLDPPGAARQWLDAMRTGAISATDTDSQRYVSVLEVVFRLPPGYFLDARLAAEVDERIVFASDASARGITFIGLCRTLVSEMALEDLHNLHVEIVDALNRRRPAD